VPVAGLGAAGWLSDSERLRAAAYRAPRRQEQFLASRWLARRLLARRFGGQPMDWLLSATKDAPPRVLSETPEPVECSISHSGDWVSCALAPLPVGLDVETTTRRRPVPELARLVCHPSEQLELANLAESEQLHTFYRLWTLKEAWLKRQGSGIDFSRMRSLRARLESREAANALTLTSVDGAVALALSIEPSLPPLDLGQCELAMSAPQYWQLQLDPA
jgi:4'-phosphopantetheinyl transferase